MVNQSQTLYTKVNHGQIIVNHGKYGKAYLTIINARH